jgi:hypothetical protein
MGSAFGPSDEYLRSMALDGIRNGMVAIAERIALASVGVTQDAPPSRTSRLVSKQSLEPEVKDQILEELIEEMLLGLPEGPEFAAFSKEAIAALSNIVSMVQLAIAERTVPSEHARKVLRSIKSNDTDLAKRRTMVAGLLEGIASVSGCHRVQRDGGNFRFRGRQEASTARNRCGAGSDGQQAR